MKPPRAKIGFPAPGWMPGQTGWVHLLYMVIVVADTSTVAIKTEKNTDIKQGKMLGVYFLVLFFLILSFLLGDAVK